jgi:hypothetical protein
MENKEMLQKLWAGISDNYKIDLSVEKLSISLKKKHNNFQRSLLLRNIIEICASVFVCVFFFKQLFIVPWLISRIGVGFILFGNAVIIIIFIRDSMMKKNYNYSFSVIDGLKKFRDEINAQIRILNNVWFWYLLFPISGILLFVSGFPVTPFYKNLIYLFAVLIFIGVIFLNKWMVNNKLKPMLHFVNSSLESLDDKE